MWLSIIMPTYNSEKTVERAIKSIIDQNRDDVEIIFMDGGSVDNTVNIADKYHDKIAKIVSEPDNGYADALNKGRVLATGEYVMMLAADDVLLDGAINKIYESLKPDTDVWCGCQIDKVELGYIMDRSSENLDDLKKGCSLKHPSTVFRKSIIDDIGGYDTSYKCNADWNLFLRLAEKNVVFQIEDVPVVLFDARGMSNSNFALLSEENAKIAEAHDFDKTVTDELVNIAYYKSKYDFFKKVLYKIGWLPIIYRIMGMPDACLSRKYASFLVGKYYEK